jgi:hypothetical protein
MPTKKSPAKKAAKSPPEKTAVKRSIAKKSVAKKMTAKVSPLRGMAVGDWVKSKTKGWQTTLVNRLLDIAKRAAPEATVSIKWGQPVIDLGGPMAWIKPAKAHVTFGFWRGAELSDDAAMLEGGARMKHLKIAEADALDENRLVAFVREAAELNRKKGDPTKRG